MTFGDGISWDRHVDEVLAADHVLYYSYTDPTVFTDAKDFIDTDTPKDKRKALDCGCHIGRWIDVIMGYGFEYTGVDQSEKALATAKENKPYGNWVYSFLWDMKFEEEYDFACCVAVLQHNLHSEQNKILPQIYKALKPGGVFFMTESTLRNSANTGRSQADWVSAVERAGFKLIKMYHKNSIGLEDHYIFLKEKK